MKTLTGKAKQDAFRARLKSWPETNAAGGEYERAAKGMMQSGYTQPDLVDDILSRMARGARNGRGING